ncbi:hypothetical protein Q9251_03005 [Alkalihalobacillus macyae]|uniref:hypothetical protein n=1 Tax=Guptibacillus hwajinpoensis TaxID=208199 RepID=UPI00273CCACA|nr:hypothetical protein [Alkalihalobacillus macyae]MDP4549844.1 hypothetical protein [Alkalihalobacillus macyae]
MIYKQRISVRKAKKDSEGKPIFLDYHGTIDYLPPVTVKCRVDEGYELKENRSSANGEMIVTKARILIKGLYDVDYSDEITYTNELNESIIGKAKQINPKRNGSGKVIITEVII